jgi:secondary thiamine-phosphate synthase enzyme
MIIKIKSQKNKEIVDITEKINEILKKQKIDSGLIFIFALHTTCAITTADLDPGTDLDYLDAINAMIPKLKYRHPHDPYHVGDHIMSSIIGPSLILPFENKNLILGTWQRVILVELDGPRERKIFVKIINNADNNADRR